METEVYKSTYVKEDQMKYIDREKRFHGKTYVLYQDYSDRRNAEISVNAMKRDGYKTEIVNDVDTGRYLVYTMPKYRTFEMAD